MSAKIQFRLLFFLAFLLMFIFYGLSSSKAELSWGTTYTINVHTDGSAQWTVERKALLETENDVLEWWNETAPEKLMEFVDVIKLAANNTQQSVGRNMSIEHVIGTYERTETYGIITYRFDWIGFAKVENKTIEIGDVFNGQFIDLNEDALLIVQYPEGYTLSEVKPEPIGVSIFDRTLSWKGPVNFSYQEPTIMLVETEVQDTNLAQGYMLVALGIALTSTVSVGFWHFVYRKRKAAKTDLVPEAVFGIEDQEQKVVALLQRAGGSLLQSTITREFGFSKSKTSQLLNKMEKKGIVTRRKKGREKIVTLTPKNKSSEKN